MHPDRIVPLTALELLLAGAGQLLRAGTTEPVSVTPHGRVGNGASYVPVLSRDGSFVAFTSLATDLVPGDTNDTYDAFVRDRQKASPSGSALGRAAARRAEAARPTRSRRTEGSSPSSRSPTTWCRATPTRQLHLPALPTCSSATASRHDGAGQRRAGGRQGNGTLSGSRSRPTGASSPSPSRATNLVPDDTNGVGDVFVRDRGAGRTERVSVGPEGAGERREQRLRRGDVGRRALRRLRLRRRPTSCRATPTARLRLPPATSSSATGGGHDRAGQLGPDGRQGNDESSRSPSRRTAAVAFHSIATNLVDGDTNGEVDVFLRDRKLGTTRRVSLGPGGAQANGDSLSASLSADGKPRHLRVRTRPT